MTAVAAIMVVASFLVWRFRAVLLGRARSGDTKETRLERWNTYVVPMLRKLMKIELAIGHGSVFESPETGERHTIATWGLEATLLPDVEYLALARPGSAPGITPRLEAVGEAAALRELLGDHAQPQTIWGHTAYLYVWPSTVDLDAIVTRLMPVEKFRERFGLAADALGTAPSTDDESTS